MRKHLTAQCKTCSLLVFLSMWILFGSCIAAPKKAGKAKSSTAETYAKTFEAINGKVMPLLESLVDDAAVGFGEKTPARRAVAHSDLSDLAKAFIVDRAGEMNSDEFYASPDGKRWLARRSALQKTFPKSLPSRLQPIRKLAKQLRTINPVPKSLAKTDDMVGQYADVIDLVCDLLKTGIYGRPSDIDDADDGIAALHGTQANIERNLTSARRAAAKKYVQD